MCCQDKHLVPPPFISAGTGLDTLSLLKTSLSALDPTFFRNALRESYKKAALPGLMDVQVPQEAVYQSELERILRTWLPSSVTVTPQSNAGGRKRSDIIIVPSENHKILLELVATAPATNVNKHFVSVLICDCCLSQIRTYLLFQASERVWPISRYQGSVGRSFYAEEG